MRPCPPPVAALGPLLAALLSACGGGSGDPTTYEGLLAAAQSAEQDALRLASDKSCSIDSNCSMMHLSRTCVTHVVPLSLLSSTALDALTAAAEQRRLFAEASVVSKKPPPPCPAPVRWKAACVQQQCTVDYDFSWPP
jgi:hypothetical protein